MAVKKSTKQAILKLGELRDDSGKSLYERVSLAKKILSDHDYIADEHKGDEFAARDYLTRKFFNGWLNLSKLLEILQLFPSESAWADREYNLDLLYSLVLEHRRNAGSDSENETGGVASKRRRVTLKDYEELQKVIEDAETRIDYLNRIVKEKDELIAQMRNRVSDVERENAEMKGRLSELHDIVKRKELVA